MEMEHSVMINKMIKRSFKGIKKRKAVVLWHQSRMERKVLKSDETLPLGKLDTGRDLL